MSVTNLTIKNISINGFKSIKDLTTRLNKGLNIIIGDNGAGKSNFLEFIYNQISLDFNPFRYQRGGRSAIMSNLINYSIDFEYEYRGDMYLFQTKSSTNRIKSSKENFDVTKILTISKYKNGNNVYKNVQVHLNDKLNQRKTDKAYDCLLSELERLEVGYNIDRINFSLPYFLNFISHPNKISISYEGYTSFDEEEGTLNSSLLYMLDMDLDEYLSKYKEVKNIDTNEIKKSIFDIFTKIKKRSKISTYLKKYTPITDIKLNENISVFKSESRFIVENIVVYFKIEGKWMPWSYLSDGTKRLFYLVSEIVGDNSKIILIEEPELGVHPQQLYKIMDFFKEMSERRQIILSTHSPIALDVVELSELDSIIITKMTPDGTKMNHLADIQKSKAKAYMNKVGSLSQYWIHSDLEK